MKAIEQANPDTLDGIFGDASWTNKERLSTHADKPYRAFSQQKLNMKCS